MKFAISKKNEVLKFGEVRSSSSPKSLFATQETDGKVGQRDPLEWFDRLVEFVNADRSRELLAAFELYENDAGLVAPKDFNAVLRSTNLVPTEAEVNWAANKRFEISS